jgi:BolA family transcriptional regulator, general stress-responsive regulator
MRQLWVRSGKKQEKVSLDFAQDFATWFGIMSIADTIRNKLDLAFAPCEISLTDDSHRHLGHQGATRSDGSLGETHFTVRIISPKFAGLSRVERQRRVYAALAEEMDGRIHALSLTALAPAET